MKYYYNEKTQLLLIDANEYTPYLTDRGYHEVTKEFYDEKTQEIANQEKKNNNAGE
jgi:hypothetical protein